MFDKFTKTNIGKDPVSAEELADVLFEIGKDLCTRKVFDAATRWLERALDALDEQELDRLSDDAGELRLSIMQQLGKSISSASLFCLMSSQRNRTSPYKTQNHSIKRGI